MKKTDIKKIIEKLDIFEVQLTYRMRSNTTRTQVLKGIKKDLAVLKEEIMRVKNEKRRF